MGYNISFSALTATAEAIDVTSNNIANAQTVGYKAGEYVFADQFFRAQDPQSRDRAGMGTYREAIRRNQAFGTLTGTQNQLDLALSGKGMFVLAKDASNNVPNQTPSVFQYTRNGQFALDSQNRIVNENGMFLVGYPADVNGNVSNASFSVLKLDPTPLDAKQSTASNINLNLDNRGNPVASVFDPTKSVSYSQSTAQTVYDASGNQHTLSVFYKKVDPAPLYFYPKVQGDDSSFQYNTKQNIYALGDTNGVLPTTFTDTINTTAADLSIGASTSSDLAIASTADPAVAGNGSVSTLQDTKLKAFPAGQDKTYLLTLNDGTELTVTKETSSTPGSTNVRFKYVSDRYEVYATLDGVNVNTGNMDVTTLSQLQKGWVSGQGVGTVNTPIISETQGLTSVNESAQVTFQSLNPGQSISLGGLTLTATQAMTATDVATAFSSLSDGAKGTDLNGTNKSTLGTYSGTFSGWDSGNVMGMINDTVTFNSTTPATNVSNLSAVVPGPTPTIIKTDGVTGSYETASATFPAGLSANQSITLGGLTFTANSTITAADVASAFAGINDGDTSLSLNATKGINYGTYTGTLNGFSIASGTGATNVQLTATGSHGNVPNVFAGPATNLPGLSNQTSGVTGVAAQYSVQFPAGGIKSGEGITIGSLTFTASRDITQLEAQAAFSGLAAGSTGNASPVALNGVSYSPSSYGTYSNGPFGSWTSDSSTTVGLVTFSSALGTSPFHGVNTLTTTGVARAASIASAPTTTNRVLGVDAPLAAAHEDIVFNQIKAGDKVTIDGLSFTPTRDISNTELAAAFQNLAANVTGGSLNSGAGAPTTYGTYSGALSANWSTGAVSGGNTVTITATTPGAFGTGWLAGAWPTAPAILNRISSTPSPTQSLLNAGVNDVTQSADVTFSSLTVGQSITVGGLTYTATSAVTADQVATAFTSLTDGQSGTQLNAIPQSIYGTFSGTVSGWNTTPGGSSNVVHFSSSTPAALVSNLTVSAPGTPPNIVSTDGTADTTESNDVIFHQLTANQSTTLGGLTFTSTGVTSAADVALAFSGLTDGTSADDLNKNGKSSFGTFSGTLTGWNTEVGLSGHVTFNSSTSAFNVVDLKSTIATPVPTIVTIDGVQGITESAAVTFDSAPMAAGDSITLAGLTFTAGSQGATAQQVANAFANLKNGDIQGLGLVNGSYSGTFTGWRTGAVSNGNQLTFSSTRPDINVTDLVATATRRDAANTRITDIAVSGAAAGTYTFIQGASQTGSAENAKVTFTALAAGRTVTLGGLTYTAGPNGATAAQVANAFAGLSNGATIGLGTTQANGGGVYSGELSNWTTSEAINNAVIFTSTNPKANVANLTAAQSGASPLIAETQGVRGSDETASVTFNNSGLVAGQTMTLGGLTFTASTTVNATQIAAAFANLNDGDTSAALNIVPSRTTYGTFSGTLTGWKTGNSTAANLQFTSTSAATNVQDLASYALTTPITINKTEGVTGNTEIATVDFTPSSLTPGQTVALSGLTFTAGASGASAADVASAFAGLNDGDKGVDLNASIKSTKGSFTGTFTGYFTVAGATNTKVVFTATTQDTNIPDINLNLPVQTTAPTITNTPGVTGVAAQYSVQFPVAGIKSGETITIGGLSFQTNRDITQLEAQAAFSGLTAGSTGNVSPVALNGVSYNPSSYGAYSGSIPLSTTPNPGAWTSDNSTTAGLVTFSSALGTSPFHGVNALSVTNTPRSLGIVTNPAPSLSNSGSAAPAAAAAYETLTFSSMSGGDSVTVDGLTFTATTDISPTQVAAAFASLTATTPTLGSSLNGLGGSPTYGTYSGTFTGSWKTSVNTAGDIVITANNPGVLGSGAPVPATQPVVTSVKRLAGSGTTSGISATTLHNGTDDLTELNDVSFSPLTAGQSITLGGLTFTPSGNATADDIAAAFANLTDGAAPTSLAAQTESTTFNFNSLAAGDWVTIGGLKYTSAAGDSGAAVAAKFASFIAGETAVAAGAGFTGGPLTTGWTSATASGASVTFTSATANSNVPDLTFSSHLATPANAPTFNTIQGQAPGTYTGSLSGWITTPGASGHVTFRSSTPASNVTNLAVSVPGPQPTFTFTQGVADVTESNDVVFHRMTKGQAVSIGGLTFISNGVTSAADVAAAFSGIADGTTAATLNAMPNAFGTFTGAMNGWNTTAGVPNHVTFTSSNPFTNVTDLAATVPGPAPTVLTTQGVANVTESANVTFDPSGLLKGQTLTLAGLTFTANEDLTDVQVAKAFSGLADGDITGAGYAYGDYSGTFTGWNTEAFNNTSQVMFSSSNPATNVADLVPTLSGNPPTITTVDGIANSNQITLSANGKTQTITLDSSTTVLDFDQLGIKINLATNGDSTSTIARIFDGKTLTVGDGNAIGTMAFVGGKNIDSLARDNFGKADFNSKMTISTTVGSGATLNKIAMTIDSTNMTAYSSAAQTYDSTTNGNPFSQLTAFAFDNYGKLTASYDNGQTVVKGQLVIADFNNTEGLIPVGGNAYEASGITGMQSGAAIFSTANTGELGALHSKTIENSNVDVTYELVKLMTLQRQYSAASQAVKTQAATLIDDAIRIGQ